MCSFSPVPQMLPSNCRLCVAGTAFLEVLQQMMTAVGGASELEVATLIQHRSPDGFLPSLSSDDSQTAAITLPTLLQSRTNRQTEPSTVQDEQIPSGLQRAVSEQPHGATDMQPQGDSEAVAQPVQTNGYAKPESSSDVLRHGDAAKGDVDTLDGTLKSADSSSNTERAAKESGNIVDFLLGQREGQTGATPNSPGHACDSRLHQLPNGLVKSAGQTGPLSNGLANTTAQPDSNPLLSTVVGAQGGILLGQAMTQVNTAEAGLSTLVAKEDMGTGQEQQEAGPSNALPNLDTMQPSEQEAGISQALPDGDMQAGASQALPDQAMRALAEDEPGPSNRAQNGAAVPQQRKRKFASVSSPLVSHVCLHCLKGLTVHFHNSLALSE